ncbi:MAG: hypothetical protein DRG83_17775 [Deltaproteobacteria bacterium]|nr:MAG: hypothetical protein DRG83_17775 [Deltaproteobacteria bacterium]
MISGHDVKYSNYTSKDAAIGWPSWIKPLVWAVLLAILIMVALPTLLYPLTRDQGIYAYIADLMMRGGAPYRDAWELKTPGVFFMYWLAFLIFDRSEFAVRLFDVLYALLSAASVYALAREVFRILPQRQNVASSREEQNTSNYIALCSAWIYAFCYYLLVHFHSAATPEAFMIPFLVASVYGIVRGVRNKRSSLLLLGGVASGFVFWFKPTGGLVILAVLIWAGVEIWRGRWGLARTLSSLMMFALGVVLGLLPIGWYLYGHGLAELLEIWRAYGTRAYLQARGLALGSGPLAMLDVIMRYVRDWQLFVWLSLAGVIGIFAHCRRGSRILPVLRQGTVIVVFLLSSVVAVFLQGKLFEYHWIPILVPMSILSASSVVGLAQEIRGQVGGVLHDMRSIFSVMIIVGLLLWMGYDHLVRYRRVAAYLTGRLSAEQYYAQFDIGKDFSHIGTCRAATYLHEHTKSDETALIWGVEPLVNFLAQRRSPTSYISFYVLVNGEDSNPRFEAWRQDFLEDIQRSPPTYIILVNNDVTPLAPLGSRAQLDQIPAFKRILETEYSFETQIEDYLFYRRRTGTGMKKVSCAMRNLRSPFHTTCV